MAQRQSTTMRYVAPLADYEIDEGGNELSIGYDDADSRPPTSTRRYTGETQQQITQRQARVPARTTAERYRHQNTAQPAERKTEQLPIPRQSVRPHWLTYVGMAMCLVTLGYLGIVFVKCQIANASHPLPTTVEYATSDGVEVRGFVDSQGNLNALIIKNNKAQIIPGQNISSIVADPTHALVEVKISKDGKSATITARGPYEDQGFVYEPREAQMNIQVVAG